MINVTAFQCVTALAAVRQLSQDRSINDKGEFDFLLTHVKCECVKEEFKRKKQCKINFLETLVMSVSSVSVMTAMEQFHSRQRHSRLPSIL